MQVTQNPQTLELRREYFIGPTNSALHSAMDERLGELEAKGEKFVHRTKIGRNATCPCGSGSKFKKCCMAGARVINTR